jgi:formate C-acetyltransferase
MLLPEHGLDVGDHQIIYEHSEFRDFLKDKVPQDLKNFWKDRQFEGGLGHLCVDYQTLVATGLRKIIDTIKELKGRGTTSRQIYRDAMIISLEAVVSWAHRYADAAEQAAANEKDPLRSACYRRVARSCRRVPEFPAANLFEGLQTIVLIHFAVTLEGHHQSLSIGLPDRSLSAFVREAEQDPDGTADLCAAFALQIAMNTYHGRASKTQAITVGGADAAGNDCCNALTIAFLDAFDRTAVSDPHIFVRRHNAISPDVYKKAVDMICRARSMPLLINDHPTAAGLINAGVSAEDAWEYSVMGCNELGIPGRLFHSAFSMHSLIELPYVQKAIEHRTESIDSVDEILALMEEEIYTDIRTSLTNWPKRCRAIAEHMPTPLSSALMRGGAERGEDLMTAMPYLIPCCYNRGLTNAVNALSAMETLVFGNREMTLKEMLQATQKETLPAALGRRIDAAPKWGHDDDRADSLMASLLAMRRRVFNRLSAEGLQKPVICHVVRSLHYVSGAKIETTPDGRSSGDPLADSVGPIGGTAEKGPTAVLNSIVKLDAVQDFDGGYNFNLTLPAAGTSVKIVQDLAESFFRRGGQELQINVLSSKTLKDAEKNPEQYKNLVVRVAGLNARFIELSQNERLELIRRAEAAER